MGIKFYNSWNAFLKEQDSGETFDFSNGDNSVSSDKDSISGPKQQEQEPDPSAKKCKRPYSSLNKYFENLGFHEICELGGGAHGMVYEITSNKNGKRVAVKIVYSDGDGNPTKEVDNYSKAQQLKSRLPEEYKFILPTVYISRIAAVPNPSGRMVSSAFIMMENLEPLPKEIKTSLFYSNPYSGSVKNNKLYRNKKILSDYSLIREIVKSTIKEIDLFTFDRLREMGEENVDKIIDLIASKFYKNKIETPFKLTHLRPTPLEYYELPIDAKKLFFVLFDTVLKVFQTKLGFYNNNPEVLESILFKRFFKTFTRPVISGGPEYKDVSFLHGLDKISPEARKRIEDVLPETNKFREAMEYLASIGFVANDIHNMNVMMRKSTNELVIVDFGLFKRKSSTQ